VIMVIVIHTVINYSSFWMLQVSWLKREEQNFMPLMKGNVLVNFTHSESGKLELIDSSKS